MTALEKYELWLSSVKDKALLSELKSMTAEEIEDSFFSDIEFGTAGVRGKMGAGSNKLNVLTVTRIARAVALFISQSEVKKIVVCYDGRLNSKRYAKLCSHVLASYGVKVYLNRGVTQTPFMSFYARKYKIYGMMVTASHNPKDYNGLKLSGPNGAQLSSEDSRVILELASGIDLFEKFRPKAKALRRVRAKDHRDYFSHSMLSAGDLTGLSITYTPLCGAGTKLVPKALKQAGAELTLVKSQMKIDPHFSTCSSPNPELPEAFREALALGADTDLIIATDPDCDRLGVMAKTEGGYTKLSGNEVGALMLDYLLSTNVTLKDDFVVTSIVTSLLVDKICKYYGVKLYKSYTGFKSICEKVEEALVGKSKNSFIFAFEESCGYFRGDHIRDKDALQASLIFASLTAYLKRDGKTVFDRLEEIKSEMGRIDDFASFHIFSGAKGSSVMKKKMATLRKSPPKEIGGFAVVKITDYQKAKPLASNVLEYSLSGGHRLVVRPSGTEPKLKIYISTQNDKSHKKIEKIMSFVEKNIFAED